MCEQKNIFSSFIDCYQLDKEENDRYKKWNQPFVQNRVNYITALTGILYLIYSQIDRYIAPPNLLDTMLTIHLFILAPALFIISALAYYKIYFKLMIVLLMLAPIVAAIGNLIISMDVQNKSFYLTEIYLIIFWIFTVSGLNLKQALISAFAVLIIALTGTYFFFSIDADMLVMHIFWMLATFSFGIVNGYILERSGKVVFLKKEELKILANTDKLTGLYNREKLDLMLHEEIARCNRFNNTFGLIIVDIDHFKSINDTYGHLVGDRVLVEISNIIKQHVRSIDIAVRWGGEEFMIIYLETDKDNIIKLSEKLRKDIENNPFALVNRQTISIGATTYRDGDNNISITKRADMALYAAKNDGRNCTKFL